MDLDFSSACFVYLNVQKSNYVEIKTECNSAILFVLSGKVSVSCIDFNHNVLISGGMLFLPPGNQYKLETIESSVFVKCEMAKNSLKKVSPWLSSLSESIGEDEKPCLILPIKYKLKCFLEFFNQYYTSSGFDTPELNDWKEEGLFLVLKNSYSMKELATFFSPILGKDIVFKKFVYANYNSVRNLQEFADLAKCSLSVFCREFKKNFGESAYQWMLKRKSQYVFKDIISTSIPFQELADKYQFSSQAHFTKFCKQRYNLTPKDLRNSSKNYNYQHLMH